MKGGREGERGRERKGGRESERESERGCVSGPPRGRRLGGYRTEGVHGKVSGSGGFVKSSNPTAANQARSEKTSALPVVPRA